MNTDTSLIENNKKSLTDPKLASLCLKECLELGDADLFNLVLRYVADTKVSPTQAYI